MIVVHYILQFNPLTAKLNNLNFHNSQSMKLIGIWMLPKIGKYVNVRGTVVVVYKVGEGGIYYKM